MVSLLSMASLFVSRKVFQAALLLILTITPNYSANLQDRTTQPQPQRTVVYGRVVYRDNQQPIRRIRVVLRSLTSLGPEELDAVSNARGEFRIEGVPAGRYFIGVNGKGVVSTDSFLNLENNRENRFDKELREYFEEIEVDGRTDKPVTVRAQRGGVITGKVRYANDEPAVDHPITVLRRKGTRFTMFSINIYTMSAMLLTDDRGVFRVSGLPTGEYVIGSTAMIQHGELVKDSTREINMVGSPLAMIFHPSTALVTQATTIRVESAEERTGVDITIPEQQMRKLSGTVRGRDDRRPVAGARVGIIRKQTYEKVGRAFWPYSEGMPRVQTDELGRWRFNEVPDGTYIIFVEQNRDLGDLSENRRFGPKQQEVEVSGSDVNTVIDVGDGGIISGTITVDGGPTPSGIYLGLTNESESGSIEADDSMEGNRFTIRNMPPGKMYLNVNFMDDVGRYYLKSITWKGKDLLNELIEMGEETKIEGIQIVLSPKVATFTVRVRTPQGKPVPEGMVLLVPANPNRWTRREAQLFGETDANGECQIVGAPVEYLVFVLPSGVQANTLQPHEIQERASSAQRISLREGERRTFDVVVPPNLE